MRQFEYFSNNVCSEPLHLKRLIFLGHPVAAVCVFSVSTYNRTWESHPLVPLVSSLASLWGEMMSLLGILPQS